MAKVKPVRIKKRRKPGLLTMMAQKYAGDAGVMENLGKALFPVLPKNGETLQYVSTPGDLISRSALKEKARPMFKSNTGGSYPLMVGVDDIDNAPAIEAEPVRHGRWISYHEADIGWDEYGYRCSECQIEIEKEDFKAMFNKRCPSCGARMDKKGG